MSSWDPNQKGYAPTGRLYGSRFIYTTASRSSGHAPNPDHVISPCARAVAYVFSGQELGFLWMGEPLKEEAQNGVHAGLSGGG